MLSWKQERMQTWKARDVEKVEQGNQSHCSLYHIILLTVPMDKRDCYRTEAFQEYRETSWHGSSDQALPAQCSGMSTGFALAHHCHPLCNRCNCPRDAQSSPRIWNSHFTKLLCCPPSTLPCLFIRTRLLMLSSGFQKLLLSSISLFSDKLKPNALI